jgi:rhodanese-related sulfurtransferase
MNSPLGTSVTTRALLALAFALALAPASGQDSFGSAPQQQPPPQQQPLQQQQQPQQQSPPGYGVAPPAQGPAQPDSGALARLAQLEQQDMGVAPSSQLKSGGLHGPTPTSIPGGRTITTADLVTLLRNPQSQALVFDVLGSPQTLPNAIPVVPASQGGDFQDQTQREFGQFLQQTTQGNRDRPMVFYCQSTQCWMSYNAALRAIALGYTQVLWYRGGLEAWQQAGLPLSGGQAPAQQSPAR